MEAAFETIRYERPTEHVARIVLARPERANAQDRTMLYELNAAFDLAAGDDDVVVVILAADGKHFSSGHDLSERRKLDQFPTIGTWKGFNLPGVEGYFAAEQEVFVGLCWRWRNFPKPTIAAVQGKAIAGGLMLVWPCDLVVAAEDAEFSDPVVALGVNGHELFMHPWELGHRKAKEMLFTGDSVSAQDAHACGMVNHVVPLDDLETFTLQLADRIARQPTMGLKLAKLAVNHALDVQGQASVVQSAFWLHQLGHSHNQQVHGRIVDPDGPRRIREQSSGRA